MKIGTLGFGYADGFNRLFSNNYKILLGDKKLIWWAGYQWI